MVGPSLVELSLEVSSGCLCRCIHCSSGANYQHCSITNGELQNAKSRHLRLISEARELGATVLSLSGGDPILWPFSILYVYEAVRVGYERVLFYTTGMWDLYFNLIDSPGAEPLGALWGIDSWPDLKYLVGAGEYYGTDRIENALTIIFSLHSHRPDVNDFIMGISGAWYTITGSIMALRAEYPKVNVEVHMVPMRPNYKHISEMRDLCGVLGVSKLSLLRFVPQTRGFSNRELLSLSGVEFKEVQNELVYEMNSRDTHPVKMRPGCPIDFRHTIDPKIKDKTRSCHAGLDLMLVRPDGSVHPCAAWKTLPDDANAFETPLAEIWENGEVFQALRRYHDGGYLEVLRGGVCFSCAFIDSCKGGCLAQKLHAISGRGMSDLYYSTSSDPLCPIGGSGRVCGCEG